MRSMLGTVLRGLRSRALLSLGTIVLTALAVGSAVVGPIFQVAVTNSYLITRLDDAPLYLTGLSWRFLPDAASSPDQALVDAVAAGQEAAGPFEPAQTVLESIRVEGLEGQARLLAKRGACDHLEVSGACPGPGEVLLLEGDATQAGLTVGDTVDLAGFDPVRMVGVYRVPTTGEEDYWFDLSRFASVPASDSLTSPTPYRPAPLVTDPATFDRLPDEFWSVLVDRRMSVPPDLTVADLDQARLTAATLDAPPLSVTGGSLVGESINDLPSLAAEIRAEQATARSSVAPAVISLVLVALALLLRLLRAAADLRLPELALASLRGLSRRQMWWLGLSEPLTLLAISAPIGAVAGLLMSVGLARAWLVPGLPLPLGWTALVAGALVVVASVGLAIVDVGITLRVTLSEQLAGVRRPRRSNRSWVIARLALVAAAIAVLASKLTGGRGQPDSTDLVLPVLLAIVAGLGATMLTAAGAGWWTRQRGLGRSLPGFVATRAISRRQEGTLVILPVTAAIAICVFGAGVYDSAAQWRGSVASTAAPAEVMWRSPLPLDRTVALTRQLDPDGDYLMAAGTLDTPGARYTVLDTTRLSRVASWPDQWTPGVTTEEVTERLRLDGAVPVVTGSRITFTLDNEMESSAELNLQFRLSVTGERAHGLYVGPFRPGETKASAEVDYCAEGCRLEEITVGGPAAGPMVMAGEVRISDLRVDGVPLVDAYGEAGWVPSPQAVARESIGEVSADDEEIVVPVDSGGAAIIAPIVSGGVPFALPVVAGADVTGTNAGALEVGSGNLTVDPVVVARSVPLLGPIGSLIDFETLTAGRDFLDQGTPVYVLARADTPASIRAGLQDQGASVDTTLADVRRTLDQGAYALTLRLYAVVALLVLLMALAGLFVSTSVQLPARRRDAAALRVVGVSRRSVMLGVVVEFAAVLGGTAVAGLVAGALAQYVVLRNVTLGFIEGLTTPALVAAIDPTRLAVLAAIIVVLFGGFAIASGTMAVRGARGATLRENAR